MSGRPSKTDQELGAMKDLWMEVRAMESEYHGMFSMFVNPTQRPGVFRFTMVFTPLMGGEPNALGTHSLDCNYPNVEQSMLAGFLWRKAIALSRMVREAEEQRAGKRIIGA
jgi:hypothetical protein